MVIVNQSRRNFLNITAMALAAQPIKLLGSVIARPGNAIVTFETENINPGATFESIKQINAGVLNMGYAEGGPINGRPVILLHGWPYDIYTYADAAQQLGAKGY